MVEIFDPRRYPLTDQEILSFFRLLRAPDQTEWEYEEPPDERVEKSDAEVVKEFRTSFLPRSNNHALWAKDEGQIVGMVGVNQFEEPSRQHCGELGIGVLEAYQRQGIGLRLIKGAIARSRQMGLLRLEADCMVENQPSATLLQKAGFQEEGVRIGAIRKYGRLRDIRLFGLLL